MPELIMLNSLIINNNNHPFFREVKSKSYKLVKLPDNSFKLIIYLKFWIDLQHAKILIVYWNGFKLYWSFNLIIPLLKFTSTSRSSRKLKLVLYNMFIII
jgi:hypothetical protein